MKQQNKGRAGNKKLTKAQRAYVARYGLLQVWIERTIVRAVTLKADEILYERGKNGLTVEFRRRGNLLEALGPYKRYQDRVIPRLDLMGRQGLPKRCKGETGRFLTAFGGREWNCPLFHTQTKSGERVAVRFRNR